MHKDFDGVCGYVASFRSLTLRVI